MLAEQFKKIKEKDIAVELKEIAEKLNENKKLDFSGGSREPHFYLAYDFNSKSMKQLVSYSQVKNQGIIYCNKEEFKRKAIAEIGEERLTNYLKE